MTIEAKIAILVLAGVGLAFLTRRSLKSFHTHGPYRLVAWVAAIALVLLNVEVWFDNPAAVHQVCSWFFLALSLFVVIYAYISLRRGRPGDSRGDASLIGVEKTTELVEAGSYRYIRHPMYASLLPGSVGVFLKDPSLSGALLTFVVIVFAALAARAEERENLVYFGEAYRTYMGRTWMFVPFLW